MPGGFFQEAGDNHNDRKVHADVRKNIVHGDALRTCTRDWSVDHARGGKRTGAKVMAMRTKLLMVNRTFLKLPP